MYLDRNSLPELFLEKVVLVTFAKIAGVHRQRSANHMLMSSKLKLHSITIFFLKCLRNHQIVPVNLLGLMCGGVIFSKSQDFLSL